MRSLRIAIWTSAEPVSVSWSRCSVIVAVLSGIARAEAFIPVRVRPSRLPDNPFGTRADPGGKTAPWPSTRICRTARVVTWTVVTAPVREIEPSHGSVTHRHGANSSHHMARLRTGAQYSRVQDHSADQPARLRHVEPHLRDQRVDVVEPLL